MPFKAREIDPAGSAQARLGAELRRRRTERGLSQARLGVLVHSSADLIRRVEATERFPSIDLVAACDRELGADGALCVLWPAADAERRRSGSTGTGAAGETQAARFTAAASDRLVIRWATASPDASIGHCAGALKVTEYDVALAESTLAMFRQIDHAHGAGHFAAHLGSYVDTDLVALLGRPVSNESVGVSRSLVAAGFFELAGYQAVDSGRPGWAQAYYGRALAMTSQAGERAYGGYLVAANLGHLALHCDHPDIALRWTRAAITAVGSAASPATRAAILSVGARAHARTGDERATTTLLTQAEELLESSSPTDEPPWIAYFNRAYLADEMAHCFHDLGRPPSAREQITDALEGVGRTHVRRLAIDAALLASTWLRSGDVEQACAVGLEAVGYAARTTSGRCVERISGLLAELIPYAEQTEVQELNEYVRAVLPGAAR